VTPRILDVEIRHRSLDPASAELEVRVIVGDATPRTEIRGRLMGPICLHASTVEVAYPLLPPRPGNADSPALIRRRVVIPEASLWDPQSPFLYAGFVELWESDQRLQRVPVSLGLRHLSLGPRGLRVSGRAVQLQGRCAEMLTEEEAARWRQEGINLLVTSWGENRAELWDVADRQGLLVLVQAPESGPEPLAEASRLVRRPCMLGWIVSSVPSAEWARRDPIHGGPLLAFVSGESSATPGQLLGQLDDGRAIMAMAAPA
jgi:hypothetical protein